MEGVTLHNNYYKYKQDNIWQAHYLEGATLHNNHHKYKLDNEIDNFYAVDGAFEVVEVFVVLVVVVGCVGPEQVQFLLCSYQTKYFAQSALK